MICLNKTFIGEHFDVTLNQYFKPQRFLHGFNFVTKLLPHPVHMYSKSDDLGGLID